MGEGGGLGGHGGSLPLDWGEGGAEDQGDWFVDTVDVMDGLTDGVGNVRFDVIRIIH